MPRKKIITRRVRRLKPTEIDYLIDGATALYDNIEWESRGFSKNDLKNYSIARLDLRGRYKDLAVIVEDMYDEWGWDESTLNRKK